MAKEPEDLVVRLLREIQKTLADHTKHFDKIERRLDEVGDGMITALGLASHAHVKHDSTQKEIDKLKKRIDRLEEKLS